MFQMADDFSPYSTGNDKDKDLDGIIRPHELTDFTGQDKIVTNLKIFIKAAKMRGEPLDHVLFHGPPGLGKTTLANIVANELGVNIKITSGPVLDKPGDLAGCLLHWMRETFFSLTRYTGFRLWWRSISIRQWSSLSSISL